MVVEFRCGILCPFLVVVLVANLFIVHIVSGKLGGVEAEGVCAWIGFNPCMYADDVVGQEEGTEPVFVVRRAYFW